MSMLMDVEADFSCRPGRRQRHQRRVPDYRYEGILPDGALEAALQDVDSEPIRVLNRAGRVVTSAFIRANNRSGT